MTENDLLSQLEAGTLPEGCFHHADHVRAAWTYLNRFPPVAAIDRFSKALQAYAASKGKASRYHETITWAYVLLINERMRRGGGESWEEFAAANPDLLDWKNPVLRKYYRAETLSSTLARQVFLMPDAVL